MIISKNKTHQIYISICYLLSILESYKIYKLVVFTICCFYFSPHLLLLYITTIYFQEKGAKHAGEDKSTYFRRHADCGCIPRYNRNLNILVLFPHFIWFMLLLRCFLFRGPCDVRINYNFAQRFKYCTLKIFCDHIRSALSRRIPVVFNIRNVYELTYRKY